MTIIILYHICKCVCLYIVLCCLFASYNMKTMLILTLHVHQNTFADIRAGNAQTSTSSSWYSTSFNYKCEKRKAMRPSHHHKIKRPFAMFVVANIRKSNATHCRSVTRKSYFILWYIFDIERASHSTRVFYRIVYVN